MEASIGEFAINKIQSAKTNNDLAQLNDIIEKVDDVFLKRYMEKELKKR